MAGSPRALEANPRAPFDERDVLLLADLSARLMSDGEAKRLSDVMSFAFWCRRSHVQSLKESYGAAVGAYIGRGTTLHIAPSNVPVNFAFSWAFSLLAGNANVVRIPSKGFAQVEVICRAIKECLSDLGDERNLFVAYASQGDTTALLSMNVDARVIWGGDETVRRIRAMDASPRCIDVAFPDRYSVAVMDDSRLAALDDAELASLVHGFYNDTYLMDQNACSSPRVVFWAGNDEEQRSRFWTALREKAHKDYALQPAVATEKYVQICRDVIDGILCERLNDFDGYLEVVPLCDEVDDYDQLRGKGGYFYECEVGAFSEVASRLGAKCQTVTCFGVDPFPLRETLMEIGCKGVDRLVPVGQAMDIDIVWDGFDLIETLSREIVVR